jgi:hypothetical protein
MNYEKQIQIARRIDYAIFFLTEKPRNRLEIRQKKGQELAQPLPSINKNYKPFATALAPASVSFLTIS